VSQIVFLTLYLGLVSSVQPVALKADAEVKSIRIVLDGATVALDKDFAAALPAVDMKKPHVRSVEEPDAEVIVVRDADVSGVRQAYVNAGKVYLDRGTFAQMFSPVPNAIRSHDEETQLFPTSNIYDVGKTDFLYPLLRMQEADAGSRPRQFADAVAVAGVQSAALGVPLLVWAPFGVAAEEAKASWGEVEDVSSRPKLLIAVGHLRDVLRAAVKDGCGYARIGR
jgi:hypothetical protein